MATLRDIRRRITSVTNTMQITSAMKMVSAAKLNRAQIRVRAAQPYAEKLRSMVISLSQGLTAEDHPLFEQREGGKSVVMVFTSDRGLCGAFNNGLLRSLYARLTTKDQIPEPEIVVFGRVGNDYFQRRTFTVGHSVVQAPELQKLESIKEITDTLVQRYLAGEINRLFLMYNHFKNPITQEPRFVTLLPIAAEDGEEAEGGDNRETLFEPSREGILDSILPNYLINMGTLAHLNTEAGEHGARMVAMESATKNAGEMIAALTLQYNRVRQAKITSELIEIINGAQSL